MARSAGRERERTVCESCELPHYADGDGCPYCDGTTTADESAASQKPDEDSGFVFGSSGPEDEAAGGDGDGGDGLVGRLKRALGL